MHNSVASSAAGAESAGSDSKFVWHLLDSGAGRPSENMALDEILLETSPELGQAVLRFYAWSEPAATFGYFQRLADVENMTSLRPLIRRPTGGGLVLHMADWTYSLVFPPLHPWYRLKAVESYRQLHQWIQAAFGEIGIQTELSPSAFVGGHGQCFVGAERFDLLCGGKKIAGAAQRRSRHGLLIQGSVQAPESAPRTEWQKAFYEIARRQWGVEWLPLDLQRSFLNRVADRAKEKYGNPTYNSRR